MRSPTRENGFVLVLTLWILTFITIGAVYFDQRVGRARELAASSQKTAQFAIDMAGSRAELLYRLAVTPVSLYGLGRPPGAVLLLDDTAYRGDGDSVVRLQDNRGLLNLNLAADDTLERFLGLLGIQAGRRLAMIDTLRDYMDEDSLRRFNGAEVKEYEQAGLPLPRNDKLRTPYEPMQIIGWRDCSELWDKGRLPQLVTTSVAVAINPNTAPWQVLATLPGVTALAAHKLVERRKLAPIATGDEVALLSGISPQLMVFQVIALPADSFRITQSAPGLPWQLQYAVQLTPQGTEAPWQIEYFYKTPSAFRDDKIENIPPLPPRFQEPLSATPALLPDR